MDVAKKKNDDKYPFLNTVYGQIAHTKHVNGKSFLKLREWRNDWPALPRTKTYGIFRGSFLVSHTIFHFIYAFFTSIIRNANFIHIFLFPIFLILFESRWTTSKRHPKYTNTHTHTCIPYNDYFIRRNILFQFNVNNKYNCSQFETEKQKRRKNGMKCYNKTYNLTREFHCLFVVIEVLHFPIKKRKVRAHIRRYSLCIVLPFLSTFFRWWSWWLWWLLLLLFAFFLNIYYCVFMLLTRERMLLLLPLIHIIHSLLVSTYCMFCFWFPPPAFQFDSHSFFLTFYIQHVKCETWKWEHSQYFFVIIECKADNWMWFHWHLLINKVCYFFCIIPSDWLICCWLNLHFFP